MVKVTVTAGAITGEALKIAAQVMPEASGRFTGTDGWAGAAIGAAAEAGLVAGYVDGTFGGHRRITRAEMAVIRRRVIRRGLVPVVWTAGVDSADAAALPGLGQGWYQYGQQSGLSARLPGSYFPAEKRDY